MEVLLVQVVILLGRSKFIKDPLNDTILPPTPSDLSQDPQLADVLVLRVYDTHDQNIDAFVLMKLV